MIGSANAVAAEHAYLGSFGPDGTPSSAFAHAGAIGVDQASGNLYVADLEAGTIFKFDESGKTVEFSGGSNEITGFSFHPTEPGVGQIAVDPSSHVFYVVEDAPVNSIRVFQPNGSPGEFTALATSELTGFGEVCGVAVDGIGDIYVGDFSSGVHIYESNGKEIDSFVASAACNLAVDSQGAVYVNYWHGAVEKFAPSSYPVTGSTAYSSDGTVDGGPAYGVAVDSLTNELYVDGATRISTYSETGSLLDSFAETGSGEVSASEGIGVLNSAETAYASDAEGKQQVAKFGPLPPPAKPTTESEFAKSVGFKEATVGAKVNPERAETNYFVEYGTSPAYGATSEVQTIPAGNEAVLVVAELADLEPDTIYHFRFVASNALGKTEGPDAQFKTFAHETSSACGNVAIRAQQGSLYLPDCRAYEQITPTSKDAGFERAPVPGRGAAISSPDGTSVVYETTAPLPGATSGPLIGNLYRATRGGESWTSNSMAPPQESIAGTGGKVPLFFAISSDLSKSIVVNENPPLTPSALSDVPSMYLETGTNNAYQLMTPAGMSAFIDEKFGGSSLSFDRIFYGSKVAQTGDAPPGEPQVYEWTPNGIHLVGVLPDESIASAAFPAVESTPNIPLWNVNRATSADGSRFFFVTRGFSSGHSFQELYMRENDLTTTNISASQRAIPDPNGLQRNIFWSASTDGSRVFFTSPSELTNDANTGTEEIPGPVFEPTDSGNDLYEYDVNSGKLTDLSVDDNPGDSVMGADVLGVIGASADGSFVYFVARGSLAAGAESGKANLYLSHEGAITYIASLDPLADKGDWTNEAVSFTARLSPNGRTLAFTSVNELTGYNNADLHSEKPDSEVFVYRADNNELICASCNPSGARPVGPSSIISRDVPLWATSLNRTLTRNVSDDGSRIFFNSKDALVPRDSNGKQDVYVYENGRPALLSSGLANQEAYFADASASGDNAFIGTRAQLLETDRDEFGDLYDVRIEGGYSRVGESVECIGDSCRTGLTGAAVGGEIGTNRFAGAGNRRGDLKCTALRRRAADARRKAQRALRAVRHRPVSKSSLRLRRRAATMTKRAQRLAKHARRCQHAAGGAG
jgi:hypothetical protein